MRIILMSAPILPQPAAEVKRVVRPIWTKQLIEQTICFKTNGSKRPTNGLAMCHQINDNTCMLTPTQNKAQIMPTTLTQLEEAVADILYAHDGPVTQFVCIRRSMDIADKDLAAHALYEIMLIDNGEFWSGMDMS